MKYVFPVFIFIGVAAACLALPSRTIHFSFSAPPRVIPRVQSLRAEIAAAPVPSLESHPAIKPRALVRVPMSTPSLSIAASSVPAVATTTQKIIKDVPIDLRSVVVVKCLFKNPAGRQATAYGSGVIINAEGYVLTARHVVDMPYTYRITGGKQGFADYALDSCRVAVPPDGTQTPTPDEIRAINPFTPVAEFAYGAQVAFVPPEPSDIGMSEGEYDFADSAILRIVSATTGVVPHSFPASPFKIFELPVPHEEVVSFGFPSGVPSYGNNFYLQGSVGEIEDLVGGDRLFKNQPVGMTVAMETIGGRSGSPVFWHGYVIGVVSSKEDYSRNTALAAIFPIARFAGDAGLAVFK